MFRYYKFLLIITYFSFCIFLSSCGVSKNIDYASYDSKKTSSATTATNTRFALSVSPNDAGAVAISPEKQYFKSGEAVTLNAVPAQGYVFDRWVGDMVSTSNPLVFVLTQNVQNVKVQASFIITSNTVVPPSVNIPVYTLATAVSPSNGGTISRTPDQATYTAGTTVVLTASSASGYTFSSWSNSSTAKTINVSLSENTAFTAYFVKDTDPVYTLTTATSPAIGGTISRAPDQATYTPGTTVALTASPASGYTFGSWSNGSTAKTINVAMSENIALTAYFSLSFTNTWTALGSRGFSSGTAKNVLIAGDNETIYVAYTDPTAANRLKAAMYSGGAWSDLGFVSEGNAMDIALSVNGNTVCVAYSDATIGSKLVVKKLSGGSWQPIASGLSSGVASDIAVAADPNGDVYVSYRDYYNYANKARLKKYTCGSWTDISFLVPPAQQSFWLEDGIPYIAFYNISNSLKITVKKYVAGSWQTIADESVAQGVGMMSLYVHNATPYVVCNTNGNMIVQKGTSGTLSAIGSWSVGGSEKAYARMSSVGELYVAYSNDTAGILKPAMKKYSAGSWTVVGQNNVSDSGAEGCSLYVHNETPYIGFTDYGVSQKATVMFLK